ncbi:hypothetical protein ACFQ7W_22670 [Streptomyces niveus]
MPSRLPPDRAREQCALSPLLMTNVIGAGERAGGHDEGPGHK